jgi:peptide/nickel transport system substrate-binding protein
VVTPVSASAKACAKVYGFLTGEREAADLGTYATNPLWKIVDGPFTLSTYDATDSAATVVPNLTYSGPVKSSLAKLVMVPFTTAASEYTALVDGTTINIGYVSPQDLPTYKGEAFNKNGQPLVGKNDPSLASRYSLDPVYPWGINYFALNYTNPTSGPIFKQLYVRQAMQSLMNQTAWIQAFDAGYGAPTYGPVPSLPPTDMATKREGSNPYPYNPSHARNLLRSHGWSVVPGGVTTCIRPGTARERCGAGIPRGATLSLNYLYYEGSTSFDDQITALKASWSQAGIRLNLEGSKSFQSVILTAAAPCTTGKACAWEIANWEGGWIYVPDYYPTGEQLFDSSAGSNFGEYSDPTADGLIRLTTSSSSLKALYNYEDYVARQLPVVWQPEMAMELNEVSKNVCGVTPEDSVFGWEAENWYFCKPAK